MARILFFDGYCNLCNNRVDWLLRHAPPGINLQFASLQGETAKRELAHQAPAAGLDPDTVIYLRDGQKLERSSAILQVTADLGGVWKLAALGFVVPSLIRDTVYAWVARNRFRWFGRRDTCRLPTPEEKARFLP